MKIAVVGATGAVGMEMASILAQRRFHADHIHYLASARSAGKSILVAGRERPVEALDEKSFNDIDVALFAVSTEAAREFVPAARAAGAVVIDNSSAFRMHPDVPLVIPEINERELKKGTNLIANPNCSTIIMALAVWPLHRVQRVRRIIVSTYQAISGAGAPAMQELLKQSRAFLKHIESPACADGTYPQQILPSVLPHPCAFNVFSHDTAIDGSGYNVEELKIAAETKKIFNDHEIRIAATCIRVPVLRAHSESINLSFDEPVTPQEAREILCAAPGVRVIDDREANYFPMPKDASGTDEVLVGRIRSDTSDPSGRSLSLFVSGDQLRKGAALNAIQIAEWVVG